MHFAPGLLKGLKTQSFMVRIETNADVGMFLPQRPFINFRRNAFLLRTLNYWNISQGVFHSAKTAKRQGRLLGTWTYFLISSLWLLRNKVTIWLLLFIISSRDEETPLLGKRINKLSPITCGYGFLSRFLSWIHFSWISYNIHRSPHLYSLPERVIEKENYNRVDTYLQQRPITPKG